jgi:hypothetical protein
MIDKEYLIAGFIAGICICINLYRPVEQLFILGFVGFGLSYLVLHYIEPIFYWNPLNEGVLNE